LRKRRCLVPVDGFFERRGRKTGRAAFAYRPARLSPLRGRGSSGRPKAPVRGASAPGDGLTILATPPTTCCDRAMTACRAPGSRCALARSIVQTQAPRPASSCATRVGQPAVNGRREDDAGLIDPTGAQTQVSADCR
jgi:hypothetical protein